MSNLTYEEYRDLVLRTEAERHAAAVENLSEARLLSERAAARASRITRRTVSRVANVG